MEAPNQQSTVAPVERFLVQRVKSPKLGYRREF